MEYYIRITDFDWYQRLMADRDNLDTEANFWLPGGQQGFRALNPGGLFLFKSSARSPGNGNIIGGGYFVRFERSSIEEAWEKYGQRNGCGDINELSTKVNNFRHAFGRNDGATQPIGCIILDKLFFFESGNWIAPPLDWGNPPHGNPIAKAYNTNGEIGAALYREVLARF